MGRDLDGGVAIVTGSAMNIGRQTYLKGAALGAAVVTHAKENREGAEETASLIMAAGGADLSEFATDVIISLEQFQH